MFDERVAGWRCTGVYICWFGWRYTPYALLNIPLVVLATFCYIHYISYPPIITDLLATYS